MHLNSIQFPSHTHTGLEIWKWPQSRLPDSWVLSHPNSSPKNLMSPPSMSRITPIQFTPVVPHPSLMSPYPGLKLCNSAKSWSHLTPIQVSWSASQLHLDSKIHVSLLRCLVSPQSRFAYLPTTSFQVINYLHPSPPKMYLTPIQASSQTHPGFRNVHLTSIQVLFHKNPNPKILV